MKMIDGLIEPKKKYVGFRFNDEEIEELKEEARREKLNLSEYIRRKLKKNEKR